MTRIVAAMAALLTLLVVWAPPARADNGPHGGYTGTNTPDGCAGCHRAHTAKGAYLLVATSTYDLCVTCHGGSGTGANTDVIDGVYLSRNGAPDEGVDGAGLLAGGFQNSFMNTDWGAGGATSRPVTSSHVVDGSVAGTVWGFGSISATPNAGLADVRLDCANCHNPHGNSGSTGQATYRILRSRPLLDDQTLTASADVPDLNFGVSDVQVTAGGNGYSQSKPPKVVLSGGGGSGAAAISVVYGGQIVAVAVTSSGAGYTSPPQVAFQLVTGTSGTGAVAAATVGRDYTIGQSDGAYMGQYYDAYGDKLAQWCAQCHTRYLAGPAAMTTSSGDAVFSYRHQSNANGVNCLSCHVAHGSAAQMSGFAGMQATVPGVSLQPSDSALLRLDNRGVCEYCHPK